jgi:S-DNA-T family DNA segregation ATPase FtsK/SpoIIIE
MELRLAVRVPGRPERDVAVEAHPDHLVGDLQAALGVYLELTGRQELFCERTNAWLDPARLLVSAGLRTGDRLVLADPALPLPTNGAGPIPRALVDLRVVGGPAAGRTIALPAAEHKIGRLRYASVVLNDPDVSPVHLILSVAPSGAVTIRDMGSERGTFLSGKRVVTASEAVAPGECIQAGKSLLLVGPHRPREPAAPLPDAAGRIAFNRPPRVTRAAPETTFSIDAPPQRERGHHPPLSTAVVPLAMGVAMAGYFRQPQYLLFMLLSPVMAAFSFLEIGIGGRRRHRRATAAFRKGLVELDARLAAARTAEVEHLRSATPDVVQLLERARALDPALWERRPDHPDWLLLRVGWADRPSSVKLDLAPGGEQPLRQEAAELAARHAVLPAVPLQVSLRDTGVLGLSGDPTAVAALARAAAVQLATMHSPEDLILAAAVPGNEAGDWSWLGWLPHVAVEPGTLAGPMVVCERSAARALVDRLLAVVTERREASRAYHGTTPERLGASVVVFLDGRAELPRGATATLLEQGPGVGVHAIWLGGTRRSLPGECGAVVEVPAGGRPVLTLPGSGETVTAGGVDGVSVEVADQLRALAPIRDASARESQAGIPRRVELLELLGLQDGAEAGVIARWIADRADPQRRQLTATLGVAAGGRRFAVSLREDGPHALVGGMTGSGKSELLQSLVASLAVAHSPRSLNFLLVDYKGGAAFKDCVDLPHTVGFVTDLDGHLVNRALTSLRAELRRREQILRGAGAKDLLDLERRDPDRTPPSLLIVVDEFAALAAELPEFVDGMVDIAQRGRSLGIHLLLATQRPQGVINDRIRANTNLRLSLRFSDESESQDVIGTRDAARPGLPPGRAFARTGPGEVVEFQAGYAGGRARTSSGPAPLTVRDLGFGGAVLAAPKGHKAAAVHHETETDLMQLVAAIGRVNQAFGLPPPPRPWLPTLATVVPVEDLPAPGHRRATIGLVDDPAGQRQLPVAFDLQDDGNLLVFGTSGSGKTSLLRAMAVSAALGVAPSDLHIYALDFATRGLKPLEALPHCGGVISGDEIERVIRLLGMLRDEVERRKRLLASTGAATLGEHLAGGGDRMPFLFVLLDGYAGFVSALEGIDVGAHVDALRELVAEGRPLGISFVISADRQAGYLNALSASVVRRVVLRLATDDEYAFLGVPRSLYAGAHLLPGRGFTESGFEVQCAVVGMDPSGAGQAAAVSALAARLHDRYGDADVPSIRLLPSRVARDTLPRPERPLEVVLGLEDVRLEPARIDLEEGHFVVAGPRRSGRTTALVTCTGSLAASPEPPDLHLLAARRQSRLRELDCWTGAAVGPDDCANLVERLAATARAQRPGEGRSAVLVIDDGEELADGSLPELDWIAKRGPEHGLRILVGAETQAVQRAFGGWITLVLRERQGLLLDPDPAVDGTIVGVQLPRRRSAWPAGRAYLVRRGVVELVQVAL